MLHVNSQMQTSNIISFTSASDRKDPWENVDSIIASADATQLLRLKERALDDLVERIEQIDNAKFFACGHGGTGKLPLLLSLMQDPAPSIRWRAAEVLVSWLMFFTLALYDLAYNGFAVTSFE